MATTAVIPTFISGSNTGLVRPQRVQGLIVVRPDIINTTVVGTTCGILGLLS